ncbi:type III pantothenate kinase [Acinetobacter qingfengensis]|uniref:Type III pantothenate kinase n=1 Tax=Acinetobacter qingfengensis TaxID=1262585 RepID=A0A1E7RCU5_9GAMM|nr:type III pantothenate kinase [Acinetobacter qingfengensis]KAA8734352.1 type III pantothenate kinase [Acinetobacter qingfengensis]OEY97113.1 pantothenate kinase [Acinetobacter qingfengensis]
MHHNLWLDLGNSRLKYWICNSEQHIIEHGAELHLQSPVDLLLGLIPYLKKQHIQSIGISSVLDQTTNLRIQQILSNLKAPVYFAQVHAEYAGLITGYDQPKQLGIDRWLQVLAMTRQPAKYCIIGCGTALTIDLLEYHQHLGGYILPNLYLQRDSLLQGTKGIKIPEKNFDSLSAGRNTSDAVHHGILLGLLGAIRYTMHSHPDYQLIFTGGDAAIFSSYLTEFKPKIVSDLLLNGLQHYVLMQS